MSDFRITRLSLDEQRMLHRIADSVKHRVPAFNGGDNGREAPKHTRRQFIQTSSGIIGVTFMPVWSTSAVGCEAVGAAVGLLITLFDVIKDVFNLGDENDPIGGRMGFNNQTGGPLSIEALLDLDELLRGAVDTQSVLLEIADGEEPIYEYSGLNAENEGEHQTGVTALGENSNSNTFQVVKVS